MSGNKRALQKSLSLFVHFSAWILLLVLVWDYFQDNLGFYPAQEVTARTGLYTLIFLVLSLACTPVFILTRYAPALGIRRPLGLYGFLFALIHLLSFTGLDYQFNWPELISYALEKRYIIAGLAAFSLLIPLAVTSFNWWMIKLEKNWKRQHRLVYIIVPLAILHFAWLVKGNLFTLSGDIVRPLLFALITAFLLIVRIPPIKTRIITLRNRYFPGKRIIISTTSGNRDKSSLPKKAH